MIAVLVRFTLGPGTRETADKMAEGAARVLRAQKGFKGITFFADYEAGDYGSFALWETSEDADAAIAALHMEHGPSLKVFEVVEPAE